MKEESENNVHRVLDLLKRKIKMETNIDLSILKKLPEQNVQAVLEIIPLAPLSMVSELPGSFYKTMKYPSKKMLCGMFENMLGWHFDNEIREEILKDMNLKREQNAIIKPNSFPGSTYIPLLMEFFSLNGTPWYEPIKPLEEGDIGFMYYTDLWSRARRRHDTYVQVNGSRHISLDVVKELHDEIMHSDSDGSNINKQIDNWLKSPDKSNSEKYNWQKIPFYYYTPVSREYIEIHGIIKIPINIDADLLSLLKKNINNSVTYLGNSEGWVEVEITKV